MSNWPRKRRVNGTSFSPASMEQLLLFKMDGPPGKTLIFRPWITCPKTGKRIYPKTGKVFPLWV